MRKRLLLLLPVVSALCVTLAFPPFELGFLAWIGLAPLLFALRRRGTGAAASLAFLFGALFIIGAFPWAFSVIIKHNPARFLFLMVFSLYFIAFGVLYRLSSRVMGAWTIIAAPAVWVALEYARANLFFLAFPWNLLGHSQYRYLPVIQIADITGVYGISFLLVMVNQCVSQLPDLFTGRQLAPMPASSRSAGPNWTAQLVALVLVLGTFFYGWHKLATPENREHIRVALVQGNILARDNMSHAEQVAHLRVYRQLTMEAARSKPALIVWPSSSLPAQMGSSRLVRLTISQLARDAGTYLLVGGAGHDKNAPPQKGFLPFSNSEFLIAPTGRLEGQYNKMRLLPFNEYLPLQDTFTWPAWITTLPASFVPGKDYILFHVSGVKFASPICWENMFPALFRRFVRDGAQFMISVTNEGFFGPTPTPYLQSMVMSVFRAIETRVTLVRAASTGISAFINAKGNILERVGDSHGTGLFVSGVLVRDVPLSSSKTFYTVYGDLFAYVVIGIAALIVVVALYAQVWPHARLRRT